MKKSYEAKKQKKQMSLLRKGRVSGKCLKKECKKRPYMEPDETLYPAWLGI
jgi:hypothetical protein